MPTDSRSSEEANITKDASDGMLALAVSIACSTVVSARALSTAASNGRMIECGAICLADILNWDASLFRRAKSDLLAASENSFPTP